MAKKIGRPLHNPNGILTDKQKRYVYATLLTDGWIERQPKGINPRIGLQQSDKHKPLLEHWIKEMRPFIKQMEPLPVWKTPPKSSEKFLQWKICTGSHPQFLPFLSEFGGQGKNKTVPKASILIQNLDWDMLAIMIMMDGSIHNHGCSIELHLQSFSKNAQDRLCFALFQKLKLKAWPSFYGTNEKGIDQYHTIISGLSLPLIHQHCMPYILPSFKYKIPELSSRGPINEPQSPWKSWYDGVQNVPWLEDISLN